MSAVKCRLYGAVQKQGPELLQDALPAAAVKMRAHLVFGAADIHSEIVSLRSPYSFMLHLIVPVRAAAEISDNVHRP